jgi:amino acid transporter
MASALTHEFGSGIALVAPNTVGTYPGVKNLVPLAMVVCGVLLLPKTALFARFSRHMPRAGSFYTWIGRTLSPPVAFILTFLYWVGLAGAMGVISFSFATFLSQTFAVAGWSGATWIGGNAGHLVLGLAVIWLFVAINARGVHFYGFWAQVLMGLVLLLSIVVIGYGFGSSSSRFVALVASQSHTSLAAPTHSSGASLHAFFQVAAVLVFAYAGLEGAPSLGGEVKDGRTISHGVWLAWGWALLLYALITLAIFSVAPWWAVSTLVQHGQTSLATVPGLIGVVAPHVIAVGVNLVTAIVAAKTINPELLVLSRTLFGLTEDHLVPDIFGHVSRHKVPIVALVTSGLAGSVFLVQTVLEGFTLGVAVRSLSVLVVAAAVAVGLLNVRYGQQRRFAGKPWAVAVVSGPGIVVAAVAMIAVAALFIYSVIYTAGDALYLQPWFETALALAVGAVLWLAARWHARRHGLDLAALAAQLPPE